MDYNICIMIQVRQCIFEKYGLTGTLFLGFSSGKEYRMAFHEQLRKLREKAGLTQEALARSADLSLSTVTKLELGGIDPAWSTVQRLAKALGVDCTALMDEGY